MKENEFETRRYTINAKRNEFAPWTEWTKADTLEEAEMYAKRIEELGFLSQIIDREDKSNAGQID